MTHSKRSKVDSVFDWIVERIDNQVYAIGERIPSVRKLSAQLMISPFTVTQAYEKLVLSGRIQARRGSGYFVAPSRALEAFESLPFDDKTIDCTWLMQHLFSSVNYRLSPGSGTLPNEWIRYERLPTVMRQTASTVQQFAYQSAHTQGLKGLREQYQLRLQNTGIQANANELITTDGVSSAMTLVTRYLLKPGDAVVVDNPCWFWLLANLQVQGLRVFGVNRDALGPDISNLKQLFEKEKVKLYVTNSVLHNPTSFNIHPSRAYQVVNLLHEYDAYLLEDDIYGWFDNDTPALRYSALDRERVFYTTGVSKLLGMDFRQAILCPPQDHFDGILQYKMLTQMSNSMYVERSVLALLTDVEFRKHSQRLRENLHLAHANLRDLLSRYGLSYPEGAQNGFFLWLNTHCDSATLAMMAKKAGYLIAPGQVFSPRQEPSTHIRINVSRTDDAFLQWLVTQEVS